MKEKELEYLLELISPDLEEQSRQVSASSLLRAIIARKFVVPEIYDSMGEVFRSLRHKPIIPGSRTLSRCSPPVFVELPSGKRSTSQPDDVLR